MEFNQCPKLNHDEELLTTICVDQSCQDRGLLCFYCQQQHSNHKIIPLKKFIKEFKNQHDSQPKESIKPNELIHNIDSFKDTAENARKILDESFANLISMINSAKLKVNNVNQNHGKNLDEIIQEIDKSDHMIDDIKTLLSSIDSFQPQNGYSFLLKRPQHIDNLEGKTQQSHKMISEYKSYSNTFIEKVTSMNDGLVKQLDQLFDESKNLIEKDLNGSNKFQQFQSNQRHTPVQLTIDDSDSDTGKKIPLQQNPVLPKISEKAKKPVVAKMGEKKPPVLEKATEKSNDKLLMDRQIEKLISDKSEKKGAQSDPGEYTFSQAFKQAEKQAEMNQSIEEGCDTELNLIKSECKSVIQLPIFKVAFVDSERIIIASKDGLPILYNHVTKKQEHTYDVQGPIADIAYQVAYQTLVVGLKSGFVQYYRKDESNKIQQAIKFSVDKNQLLLICDVWIEKNIYTIGEDKIIKCFSGKSGRELHRYEGFTDVANALLVQTDKKQLVVGGVKIITIFDKETKKIKNSVSTENQKVLNLFTTNDESEDILAVLENRIFKISSDTFNKQYSIDLNFSVNCAGFIPQWSMFLFSGMTQLIQGQQKQKEQVWIYSISQQTQLEVLDHKGVTCIEIQNVKGKKQVIVGDRQGNIITYLIEATVENHQNY